VGALRAAHRAGARGAAQVDAGADRRRDRAGESEGVVTEIKVEGGDNIADVAVRAAAHVGPCFFVFNGIRVESDGTRSWAAMVHDCQLQAAARQAAERARRCPTCGR
jgi:hypothetical protein